MLNFARSVDGPRLAADLPLLLKDIEFGAISRKVEAIGKLYTTTGVHLSDVQPILQRTLQSAPRGSLLKFYAAYTLAYFGDNSDAVAEAVRSFMSADPFDGPDDTLVNFPWTAVPENPPMHPAAIGQRIRRFSTQIAVLEAFGYMRGSEGAALGLSVCLNALQDESWRLWAIYAAGANGSPSLRPTLEYLRDREPGSIEAGAARLALDHFGTWTVLEIAALHARLARPKQDERKSGCFIATATYGDPEASGVKVLQEFRDQILLPSRFGTALVAGYYRVSPPFAQMIRPSRLARTAVRKLLVEPAVRLARRKLRAANQAGARGKNGL